MSFTLRKSSRILERSQTIRRELMSFVIPVTVWAVLLAVFGNSLFSWVAAKLGTWARANMPLAFLVGAAAFVLLAYLGMLLLAGGWTGGTEEARRFKILLPIGASSTHVAPIPVKGYHVPEAVSNSLTKGDAGALGAAYARLKRENAGRPFRGELHAALVEAVADQMAQTLISAGRFLLSDNAEYHGLDFGALSGSGRAIEVTLEGTQKRIHLPQGCRASLRLAPKDRYGKTGAEVAIEGPFGDLRFTIKPQWAHLSGPKEYHGRSYALASELMGETGNGELWMVEIPAEICVRLRNRKAPWFFLRQRFEIYADWLDETVQRIEEFWDWEQFMERTPERMRDAANAASVE